MATLFLLILHRCCNLNILEILNVGATTCPGPQAIFQAGPLISDVTTKESREPGAVLCIVGN